MSIALVREWHDSDGGAVNSKAIVPPATIVAGNLLLFGIIGCDFGTNDLASVSDTKGNPWNIVSFPNAKDNAGHGFTLSMGWSILTAALTTSDSFTPVLDNTNGLQLIAAEFSGIAASPFDQVMNSQTTFNSTHLTTPNVTTVQADELLIGSFCCGDAVTWSADTGAGWTALENYDPFSAFRQFMEYRIVSSTGNYAASATTSAGAASQDQIITFKASSVVVGPGKPAFLDFLGFI